MTCVCVFFLHFASCAVAVKQNVFVRIWVVLKIGGKENVASIAT